MTPLFRPKLFLIGLIALFLAFLFWFLFVPPSRNLSTKVMFFKKGTPLKKIASQLKEEGIIRSEHLFVAMTQVLGKKGEIKAGEYELNTRMLPLQILDTLVKGQVKRHLVTIPEGYTLFQIAQLLEDLEIVEKEAFLYAASSPTFIASLDLPGFPFRTLEGYLFPNTYHLIREMNSEEVIAMMVREFRRVFNPDLLSRASQLGMSERDTVVLASIIEKETSFAEEKPLISAVFHNRLKKKIPLQSDPTVIYGIRSFNGNLKREDLRKPSPHNTYLFLGLPPTPICNPGESSLLAALNPAPVPYLFFVSKNDGSHYFSSSLQEHNRAVSKYQMKNNLTKK